MPPAKSPCSQRRTPSSTRAGRTRSKSCAIRAPGSCAPGITSADGVERNLHDGVQQRLVAVQIELSLAGESVALGTRERLQRINVDVSAALEELREVAHGLNPPVLAMHGLVAALRRALAPVPVRR